MADEGVRYPEARELVMSVMQAYGIDPNEEGAVAQLGRATGLDSRYLYRWFSGEYRPNLSHALDMLRRAGLMNSKSVVKSRSRSSNDSEAIEQLQARIEELTEIVSRFDSRQVGVEKALSNLEVWAREESETKQSAKKKKSPTKRSPRARSSES